MNNGFRKRCVMLLSLGRSLWWRRSACLLSSPRTSEAIRTSLMVSFPWKNRRRTTSTTSTCVAYRLSPSLHGESALAAVEMHHDSGRIGHQRLFADKHSIRRYWPRGLSTRGLSSRGLSSRLSVVCSVLSVRGSCVHVLACALLSHSLLLSQLSIDYARITSTERSVAS